MFSLYFDIFIYSLIMLQFMIASVFVLVSNILLLIQLYYLCYVYQIVYLADVCNVMNVHQCNYCHSLNKLYCLMSSMQNIEKLLILKKIYQTLMLLNHLLHQHCYINNQIMFQDYCNCNTVFYNVMQMTFICELQAH